LSKTTFAISQEKEEAVECNFSLSVVKKEGTKVIYDAESNTAGIEREPTTYVERRVPKRFEERIHQLIDKFLSENSRLPVDDLKKS